jgi:hypothetical protein
MPDKLSSTFPNAVFRVRNLSAPDWYNGERFFAALGMTNREPWPACEGNVKR